MTFPAGVNMVSFNVTILNDGIAECAKLFTLDLDIPAAAAAMGVIRGSPDTATVHITDDDGEKTQASFVQISMYYDYSELYVYTSFLSMQLKSSLFPLKMMPIW